MMFYKILELNFTNLGGGRKEARGHRFARCLAQREAPSHAPPEPQRLRPGQGTELAPPSCAGQAAPGSGLGTHPYTSPSLFPICPGTSEASMEAPQQPTPARCKPSASSRVHSPTGQERSWLTKPPRRVTPGPALLGSVYLGEFS